MIIIFGNGRKEYIEAKGKFKCPNCNFFCIYIVKKTREYFTLFFVSIWPINEKSQPYVECQSCKKKFETSILDQNNYYLDDKPVN